MEIYKTKWQAIKAILRSGGNRVVYGGYKDVLSTIGGTKIIHTRGAKINVYYKDKKGRFTKRGCCDVKYRIAQIVEKI